MAYVYLRVFKDGGPTRVVFTIVGPIEKTKWMSMKENKSKNQNKTCLGSTAQASPFYNVGVGYQVVPCGVMLEPGYSRKLEWTLHPSP